MEGAEVSGSFESFIVTVEKPDVGALWGSSYYSQLTEMTAVIRHC
jgi:hypothetical protein